MLGEVSTAVCKGILGYQQKCKGGVALPAFALEGDSVVVNPEGAEELLEGKSGGW